MKRHLALTLTLTLALLASCGGGDEEAGGLTADERQRLENIADRLDEESAEVRDLLEANAVAPEPVAAEPGNETR